MFIRFRLIGTFVLIIMIFINCGKNTTPTQIQDQTVIIDKSLKRGLAYDLTNAQDFDSLKSAVSWWYNWYFNTDAPDGYYTDYQMEFIPMLWGRNTAFDLAFVEGFILNHSEVKYLLLLNEPNLTDQANRTPQQAAADWINYEQIVADLAANGRTVYLVGPAMNWGTMANYNDPVVWLDAFINAYKASNSGKEPQIDYLAFHWYDYGLAAQLDRLQKYGKKIWITEMANWNANINSYQKQAEQMRQMVALCESREDVFRYAWFIGRGAQGKYSNIFDSDPGKLNNLGKLYISLPYNK